jgi:hypothetical protein
MPNPYYFLALKLYQNELFHIATNGGSLHIMHKPLRSGAIPSKCIKAVLSEYSVL